jgi:hypothetical protein
VVNCQQIEKPILEQVTQMVKDCLLAGRLLPKSNFAKALNYYMGLAAYLPNYLDHADARLDNTEYYSIWSMFVAYA